MIVMTAGAVEGVATTGAVVVVMISSGVADPGAPIRAAVVAAMTNAARLGRKWSRPKESR